MPACVGIQGPERWASRPPVSCPLFIAYIAPTAMANSIEGRNPGHAQAEGGLRYRRSTPHPNLPSQGGRGCANISSQGEGGFGAAGLAGSCISLNVWLCVSFPPFTGKCGPVGRGQCVALTPKVAQIVCLGRYILNTGVSVVQQTTAQL